MPAAPKIILLENPAVSCTLKKVRRSRSLRISVRQDGRVVVTAPYWASFKSMERFLGEQREWLAQQLARASRVAPLVPSADAGHYARHREQARAFIHQKLERFNRHYGFAYRRVCIRNQATRWGSCSEHANLNFSYKLLFVPEACADYVIVHELCHLKELNHSSTFWKLVGETIPDYRAIRKKLNGSIA